MPLYDYRCPDCGDFSSLRAVTERNAPCLCPGCGTVAVRVLVTAAPALTTLSPEARAAHVTNERARHEPQRSAGHNHGPGCGCASPAKTKTFVNRRPWMISH